MEELARLKGALSRLAAGQAMQDDQQAIYRALHTGKITLATGTRAVAIGGHATDVIILTGDNNKLITFEGQDAATVKETLAALLPSYKNWMPAAVAVVIAAMAVLVICFYMILHSRNSNTQPEAMGVLTSHVQTVAPSNSFGAQPKLTYRKRH